MFIAEDIDSDYAQEAYQIFAEEIDDLLGILVMQYYPYEGGNGIVLWYENHDGIEIPVVSANFSLWANLDLPGSGTPAKIARLINEKSAEAETNEEKYNGWTVVHAWSGFQYNEGDDEEAENGEYLPPGNGFEAGVTPTKWCVDRLESNIKVVTAEEMLWRIRMENNPEQTRALIDLTSIADHSADIRNSPTEFKLLPNYPNPFNPTTKISYLLPISSFVSLEVFDMLGKQMMTKEYNIRDIRFDLLQLQKGIYFIKIKSDNGTKISRIVKY
jgi:hypothetical protein